MKEAGAAVPYEEIMRRGGNQVLKFEFFATKFGFHKEEPDAQDLPH